MNMRKRRKLWILLAVVLLVFGIDQYESKTIAPPPEETDALRAVTAEEYAALYAVMDALVPPPVSIVPDITRMINSLRAARGTHVIELSGEGENAFLGAPLWIDGAPLAGYFRFGLSDATDGALSSLLMYSRTRNSAMRTVSALTNGAMMYLTVPGESPDETGRYRLDTRALFAPFAADGAELPDYADVLQLSVDACFRAADDADNARAVQRQTWEAVCSGLRMDNLWYEEDSTFRWAMPDSVHAPLLSLFPAQYKPVLQPGGSVRLFADGETVSAHFYDAQDGLRAHVFIETGETRRISLSLYDGQGTLTAARDSEVRIETARWAEDGIVRITYGQLEADNLVLLDATVTYQNQPGYPTVLTLTLAENSRIEQGGVLLLAGPIVLTLACEADRVPDLRLPDPADYTDITEIIPDPTLPALIQYFYGN